MVSNTISLVSLKDARANTTNDKAPLRSLHLLLSSFSVLSLYMQEKRPS
ncbi:hypothetical protein B4129_1131 [Bacillus safensis]|nr:hypothetical protein B4129_1131 [Bacillus safensis]KIL10529.1 hypothetical protein B4107_1082 [Bacillus safensis]